MGITTSGAMAAMPLRALLLGAVGTVALVLC